MCCALKTFIFVHSYLVHWLTFLQLLNYWIFRKCKIPSFLLKRGLSIWALKICSLRKKDWFFLFVHIKTSYPQNMFILKCREQWLSSAKDNVHVFIYTKSKKTRNVYIYICKNQNTLNYVFIHKNPDTLRCMIFIKKLNLANVASP